MRTTTDGELEVSVNSKCGLSTTNAGLTVDPRASAPINIHGQNLSDDDTLLVWDNSRSAIHSTTLSNLYEKYIHLKVPKASGQNSEIQFKTGTGFGSSAKLSYDAKKETLKADGTISTAEMKVENSLLCHGAVYHNITMVSERNYEVRDTDYTILCDTVKNPVIVKLPPACNNRGRILIIKKTNTDKYNIKSEPVRLRVDEGRIDVTDEMIIKMNYSSRTLQSDGTNWWLIGTKGT